MLQAYLHHAALSLVDPFDVSHDALRVLEFHVFWVEIHAQRLTSKFRDWYIESRDSCCAEYESYNRGHNFIIQKLYQSEICDIFLHFDMILLFRWRFFISWIIFYFKKF